MSERERGCERPDPREASEALESAQEGLSEAHKRMGKAVEMAAIVLEVQDANHFAQRLERAYRGK